MFYLKLNRFLDRKKSKYICFAVLIPDRNQHQVVNRYVHNIETSYFEQTCLCKLCLGEDCTGRWRSHLPSCVGESSGLLPYPRSVLVPTKGKTERG